MSCGNMVREFNAQVKQINAILRNEGKFYSIPRYQRGYAWMRSQYDTFWNDLIEEEWDLFIGTILLNSEGTGEDEDRVEVIDGQQRLLTITILLSSIRDALDSLGFEREAAGIQGQYIARQEWIGEDEKKPVILTGEKLRDFFENRIQKYPLQKDAPILEANNDEEKRVKAARSFFDRQLRDGLKTFSNWPTFPQLYVNGQLVGGSDIVEQMFDSGELATLLDSVRET